MENKIRELDDNELDAVAGGMAAMPTGDELRKALEAAKPPTPEHNPNQCVFCQSPALTKVYCTTHLKYFNRCDACSRLSHIN